MRFFCKNRFIATVITISFVGTSLLAPLSYARAQTLDDIFNDPNMQKDAAGIIVSCVLAAYLPDAIDTVAAGAGEVVSTLGSLMGAEMDAAASEGTAKTEAGKTEAQSAEAAATASAAAKVPIVGSEISTALSALSTSLEGVQTSDKKITKKSEEKKEEGGAEDTITDCLVYGAGQLLLKQLTNNIVKWIKGGFHGSPSFAVDTHEVFLDLADMVAGDLAREIRGIAMCKFSANFQNDLANNIELSAKHIYKFNGATKCPFPETINVNSSDFYKGINNFTWAGMEYAMTDAGNPFGVALLSGQELSLRSSEKADVRKQELSWSNGFTNMVDTDNCKYPEGYLIYEYEVSEGKFETRGQYDRAYDSTAIGPNPEGAESGGTSIQLTPKQVQELQKTYCKTTTPGKIVGDQLTKALGVDADRLGLVDSLNKIIAAVIERLTQDAAMGVFKAVSGQSEAKVQQNYITNQDKTAETMAMENYAIKSAKDELAAAQQELAAALATGSTSQETIALLREKVSIAQRRVDEVTSAESAIARQNELNAAHAKLNSALSDERSAQARADAAERAYYNALRGSLDGGTYIQPDPATLASLKSQLDYANNELVRVQGVTANARQRLYDAQHP